MKTFSTDCLRAIAHLSKPMQNRIIADVTRYQLTGEIPEKLPPMRKALFISLILMLNPEADLQALNDTKDVNDLNDLKATKDTPDSAPLPPVSFPEFQITPMPSRKPTRAERRRLMRILS